MKNFYIENCPTYIRIYCFGHRIFSFHKKISYLKIQDNYKKKIAQLKKTYGKKVIRVGFLVCEPSKWQYQSLYDALEKSPQFEPVVLVTKMHKNLMYYVSLHDCYDFFVSLGLRTKLLYDQKKGFLPPSVFNVDIVFYQQPWFLHDVQAPVPVSQYALTCYMGYGLTLVKYRDMYTHRFHEYLWTMFISHKLLIDDFERVMKKPVTNCKEVPYSKLDMYHVPRIAIKHRKKIVIYAPHHSFESKSLRCATFHYTGKAILNLAKRFSNDIYWIFKPHPRFRYAVIKNNVMKEEELINYYEEWNSLGEIYEGGDYFDKFCQSSALITDCLSFLGEYLPTENPVFHLVNNPDVFNELGREIISSYYHIEDISLLDNLFERVVINEDDFLREKRRSKIPLLFNSKESSAAKILEHLEHALC